MHYLRDSSGNISLKYVSLVVLCVQNSTLAILMRLSRIGSTEKFNSATAVVLAEIFKVSACIAIIFQTNDKSKSGMSAVNLIKTTVFNKREMMRIAIPATLYLIQNNLQYISISNLDAATYQVLYQLKVLTTAFFSVTILGRSIISYQWMAIVVLMIGVALVQLQESKSTKASTEGQNAFFGFVAVILACLCSGFAGVYFEKILKNEGSKATIWERNIQMGLISGFFGICGLVYNNYDFLLIKGFFFGYRPVVWLAISVNAFGGLLTAVVVKYADNILKAFATSIAIVLSCIMSFFLFGTVPTFQFAIGAILVNGSVYIYGASPSWIKSKDEKDITNEETNIPLKAEVEDRA